eukprot:SAG31_NODE_47022_length_252_cov_0.660131_1_plen_45_part_01
MPTVHGMRYTLGLVVMQILSTNLLEPQSAEMLPVSDSPLPAPLQR